jgi:hypothetical protein
MTFADARLATATCGGVIGICVLADDQLGVGSESDAIWNAIRGSEEHYWEPFLRSWTEPTFRFMTLKSRWESETRHLSSVIDIAMHPAYQEIIGMGSAVIPMILTELAAKPNHWFWALKAISGMDPVPVEERGRIAAMREAWLQWGRDNGYSI